MKYKRLESEKERLSFLNRNNELTDKGQELLYEITTILKQIKKGSDLSLKVDDYQREE
jgi:hypothetical protein|tara:strand:- start:371 stop:544 length:174 start_codon:yes stop_codon:yes gene_type:complete